MITKGAANLSDTDKVDLQASMDQAVKGAQLATVYNKTNYLNFQALGSIYQSLASFGVKDVYVRAFESYKIASDLNPNNPGLKLALSGVSKFLGKLGDAKDYANAALLLKPDYIDALIVLSQIAKIEGNKADAISYGEKALSFYPTNADLIKYVNSLKNENNIPVSAPTSDKTTKTTKP